MSEQRYIVISPVKDEVAFVGKTLESIVSQKVKPFLWLIVDDGSTDGTREIIESFVKNYDFIRVMESGLSGRRAPGSRVVRAFQRGYESITGMDYGFIVKLDCDLSFEADYFEKLLEKFSADPKLGIASGVYYERSKSDRWQEIKMPPYHAAGAAKVIRRACFEEIGGFIPARGWDTVDEIRAMARGWRTGHFRELPMKHWKIEGSGIGSIRTNFMHGEIYYMTGGSGLFFALKFLRRLFARPVLLGGLALFWGYVRTMFSAKGRLVTPTEADLYRRLLVRRLWTRQPVDNRREAY